ncbi:MAG: hypothetical protein IPK71_12640 [Myxococcales bacterium]|nr:hypothetical protein [Myxococcales bacterium]
MIDERLKNLRGASRRDFIKWSTVMAAALGLERSKMFDVLNDTAGSAMADSAAIRPTAFTIFQHEGNGGLANFQLLFPQTRVATGNNPAYPFHAMGKAIKVEGTNKDMYVAPEMANAIKSAKYPFTAFMCGRNETHTGNPTSTNNLGGAGSLLANTAAIQQKVPTLLPFIAVGNITFGTADGAPAPALVANAGGMVDLFNSNASKTLLNTPKNAGLAEAYYKAFLNLNAASNRATMVRGNEIGRVSMNLLGKNLAAQLQPTTADRALFGLNNAGVPAAAMNVGNAIITAIKAFGLGLSAGVAISGFRNDPHGMFANGDAQAQGVAKAMGDVLDGMFKMAKATPDPASTTKTILDSLVWAVFGDTPKSYTARGGWPDGSAMGSNMLIAYGAGFLKTGWFGGLGAQDNQVDGFDPATGNAAPYDQNATGLAASAAVAYAVAKGDARAVNARVDMAGLTNLVVI